MELIELAKGGEFSKDKNIRVWWVAKLVLDNKWISLALLKQEMKILSLKHPEIYRWILRCVLGI